MTDYVYVLGFTDGVVKVGRTKQPAVRILQHKKDAFTRAAKLNGSWVGQTTDPLFCELGLKWIGNRSFKRAWGLEYYRATHSEFMTEIYRHMHKYGFHLEGRTCERSPFPRQIDPQFSPNDLAKGLGISKWFILKAFEKRELKWNRNHMIDGSEFTRWMKSLPDVNEVRSIAS